MIDAKRASTGNPPSTSSSLLQRVQAQDGEAWERLVDLYGPLVYYWCRQQALQPEDMADVFQEVFRAVATHIGQFRKGPGGGSFRGWLLTITRSKLNDHVRRQRRQVQATGGSDAQRQLAELPAPLAELDSVDAGGEEKALLQRALNLIRGEFEEKTWQAFWRVTVEERLPADVAADLGISLNAVYKAKGRVLQRLRQELGDLIE